MPNHALTRSQTSRPIHSACDSHSCLHEYLRIARGVKMPQDGYFLRAESFFNVATNIEQLGVRGYGSRPLHEQSHGESFMALLLVS